MWSGRGVWGRQRACRPVHDAGARKAIHRAIAMHTRTASLGVHAAFVGACVFRPRSRLSACFRPWLSTESLPPCVNICAGPPSCIFQVAVTHCRAAPRPWLCFGQGRDNTAAEGKARAIRPRAVRWLRGPTPGCLQPVSRQGARMLAQHGIMALAGKIAGSGGSACPADVGQQIALGQDVASVSETLDAAQPRWDCKGMVAADSESISYVIDMVSTRFPGARGAV